MLQISFSFVVFPSILIAYIGQAAYLRKFPEKVSNTFYASIPGTSLKFKRSIDTFFYNIIHGLIGISFFLFPTLSIKCRPLILANICCCCCCCHHSQSSNDFRSIFCYIPSTKSGLFPKS